MARRRHVLKRPVKIDELERLSGSAFQGQGTVGGSMFTFFVNFDGIRVTTGESGRNARFVLARAYDHLKDMNLLTSSV